jgi:hypothetical protein
MAATLLGVGALLALVVQQLRCPYQEALHLLVWHLAVPGLLLVALLPLAQRIARACWRHQEPSDSNSRGPAPRP